MEHCSQCGGTLKIIATIEHPSMIAKIPSRLARPTTAPSSDQGFRSISAGLIPHRPRSHPVQPLSRQSPLALPRPETPNAPKHNASGRGRAR
jgi:hypothetical protein